ncbi:MAG: hypothetical protein JKY95_01520 [Planctomycetaceae bacterium]|nr:hypothetical protein [Planctomycetaceae bacterium]
MNTFIFRLNIQVGMILLITCCQFISNPCAAQETEPATGNAKTTSVVTEKNAVKAEPIPLSQSPASVFVTINVDPHDADATLTKQWSAQLSQRLRNAFGQTIILKIDVAHKEYEMPVKPMQISIAPNSLSGFNSTQVELYLTYDGRQWEIRSRSWLALTDQWSESPPQKLSNPQAIVRYLADTVALQFRPVIQIGAVELRTIEGDFIGGEFLTPDDSARRLHSGDVLGVVMLYFNRNRKLQARQLLPWTYLEVTDRNRAQISCKIISAFRSPIPRSRRRVEVMAYRINSLYPTTDARVMIRDKPNQPYRLTQVYLSSWSRPASPVKENKTDAKPDSKEQPEKKQPVPSIVLTTSREGTLLLSQKQIEQKLGPGLVKIEVMSSDAVVASVPWLPGSTAELELTVPNDFARIEAHLRLEQIKTELLRVTAKRATLIAALKQLANNPREIDPKPLFQEIEDLPSQDYFHNEVALVRIPATAQLIQKGNRTAARDVKKLCEQTEAIIQRHLNDEPIEELKLRLGTKKTQSQKTTKHLRNRQY